MRNLERAVDRKLADLKIRFQRIRALRKTVGEYGETAANQSHRVDVTGWLQEVLASESACPVCGSDHDSARAVLSQVADASAELSRRRAIAGDAPAALEREEQEIAEGIRIEEEMLASLRTERGELEGDRAKHGGQALDEVYRFVGRVEEAIKNIQQTEASGELRTRITSIEERLEALSRTLDRAARERRLAGALQVISRNLAHYAQFLGLERSDDAIDLRIKELTLVFTSQAAGREDFLWEIGSGANWMGYHLATMLALHEVFLRGDRSPVPTFLIVDQPSQVYFPSGWPVDDADRQTASHDIEATRRIFETLAEGMRRMNHKLQIIVTEHADDRTLSGIPGVHTVADWHPEEGEVDYLIPRAWLPRD